MIVGHLRNHTLVCMTGNMYFFLFLVFSVYCCDPSASKSGKLAKMFYLKPPFLWLKAYYYRAGSHRIKQVVQHVLMWMSVVVRCLIVLAALLSSVSTTLAVSHVVHVLKVE